jgi:hypothetical protein
MASVNEVKLKITIIPQFKISLFDAIKLRISGSNFQPIVENILKKIEKNFNKKR